MDEEKLYYFLDRVVQPMHDYQKMNNITGYCVSNSQYLYSTLKQMDLKM